ncbi:Calcium-independent phospholipase A2-gamma [Madurella fahalii]|uniref:Calcium-independent phospholipase A2-gamma n=1 Tax=Madurella fahalii TaxID=1157608 RepID=A0ABQ0FZQ6_9PEZI
MSRETTPGKNEAVNLLALDGGGVRGVSSLVILHKIMTEIKESHGLAEIPKPCEFFHMIAGTSTGGLIAIMLGRLRMSTAEALEEYDRCASKIFSKKNLKKTSLSARFRATALQEVVEDLVKRRNMGELMRDPERPEKGKALVCVMPSEHIGEPRLVRSFGTDPGAFGDDWDTGITIWQAARATTAASTYFKPQKLGIGLEEQLFIDAAIGINNPIEYLLKEAVDEFGSARRLGCVVSIGTGTRDVKLSRTIRGLRYYFHVIKTVKSTATDGEETHRRLQARMHTFPGAYFRFNVPEAAEQVGLSHYKKLPILKELTTEYLAREGIARQVRRIARGLKTDKFDHGLTLGHLHSLDKDQLVLSNDNTRVMGVTSHFFTGRQDILERLDSFFSPRNTEGKPRREFLLYGMGGVGKTEIALKTAEDLESRFKYIFYIDGSSSGTIMQSYATIATDHGLGGGRIEEMRAKAMRWIEGLTEEWLLIFDDFGLSDRRGQIPGRGKGNIIYTSRSTRLRHDLPSECVYEVAPFGEEEAVELFLKASGSTATSESSQDRASAQAIVQELGCLPLAVDKAAAAIRDSSKPLNEYLEELREKKVRIHFDPRFKDEDIENPIVYATLELSYEAIITRRRREGRDSAGLGAVAALKVLNLLSFFHYRGVEVAIISRAAKAYHDSGADTYSPMSRLVRPRDTDLGRMLQIKADGHWDSHWFGVGLNILRSFSLVKVDYSTETISMHVLVHTWARRRMESEMSRQWALVARVLLIESIDHRSSAQSFNLEFARKLRPHFDVCLKSEMAQIPFEQYEAYLLEKLAFFHAAEHQFVDAKECLSKALRIVKLECAYPGWAVIRYLLRLGRLNHEMGCLGEAELMFLDAIDRLHDLHDASRGDKELQPMHGFSMALAERILKSLARTLPEHASHGLFKFLPDGSVKRIPKGKEPAPREPSLSEPEEVEAENINILINFAHADLAKVYMDQDRYGMGLRMLRKAVGNLEQHLDKWNPELLRLQIDARMETDFANYQFWHGFVQEVDSYAVATEDLDLLQSEALRSMLVAHAYSIVRHREESWSTALNILNDLYPGLVKVYGIYHRIVLRTMRYQVHCLITGEQYDRAAELARLCLERAKKGYGKFHMETIMAYDELSRAIFFHKMEVDKENCMILEEAYENASIGLGRTHSTTKRIQGRLEKYKRSMEMSESGKGDTEDDTADLNSYWQGMKTKLESMRAEYGPNHVAVRAYAIVVGDHPPRSKEEHLERVRIALGPHNSLTKKLERELEMERAALAQSTRKDTDSGTSRMAELDSPGDASAAKTDNGDAPQKLLPNAAKTATAGPWAPRYSLTNHRGSTAKALGSTSEINEDATDNDRLAFGPDDETCG